MTRIYFVRHAEPVHSFEDDRTRPLSEEGQMDSKKVTDFLASINVDCFYSSPYKRTVDTIYESSIFHGISIVCDERLKERGSGTGGNVVAMFKKRWSDFSFCENGGETLGDTQKRNMSAIFEILNNNVDKAIVVGTHGTALSTILNYYNPKFGYADFMQIINYMPYIIRLDFEGMEYVGKTGLLAIKKEFKG